MVGTLKKALLLSWLSSAHELVEQYLDADGKIGPKDHLVQLLHEGLADGRLPIQLKRPHHPYSEPSP